VSQCGVASLPVQLMNQCDKALNDVSVQLPLPLIDIILSYVIQGTAVPLTSPLCTQVRRLRRHPFIHHSMSYI
jgi:hypothetical protein